MISLGVEVSIDIKNFEPEMLNKFVKSADCRKFWEFEMLWFEKLAWLDEEESAIKKKIIIAVYFFTEIPSLVIKFIVVQLITRKLGECKAQL